MQYSTCHFPGEFAASWFLLHFFIKDIGYKGYIKMLKEQIAEGFQLDSKSETLSYFYSCNI